MVDGGGWSVPCPSHATPERKTLYPLQEVGWAIGLIWTGADNLVPTGIRSPDCPACNESPCPLRYPCSNKLQLVNLNRFFNAVNSSHVLGWGLFWPCGLCFHSLACLCMLHILSSLFHWFVFPYILLLIIENPAPSIVKERRGSTKWCKVKNVVKSEATAYRHGGGDCFPRNV